ncbi:hypothetical protein [Maricaulis sp.]|uniref:hypothetical protein n=1 Tax=Maricaulis sp. TaxID=1486257 RepID=UPI0025BA5968|nr:hypothetical protein [Maricaulis sp.]
MKTALNIISIAVLGAIAGGIYLGAGDPDPGSVTGADTMPGEGLAPDPAPVADTIPADPLAGEIIDPTANGIVHTVEGTSSGYFIANEEIRFGDLILENIELWPAMPECDEPAYVRLAMEDTSDQLGENEYGPYFRLYAMTIDSASITDDGVMITASDADIGTLVIEADYVDGALAEWQTGADAIDELLVGTATLNGDVQPARFAFWIGD